MILSNVKNKDLLDNFSKAVVQERHAVYRVIVWLSEIDRRRLYAREGFSSLFAYLQVVHHYSEGAAYRRIKVARLSQTFPNIIRLLKEGKLSLMNISLMARHLTKENEESLVEQLIGKSSREAESLLASFFGEKQDRVRDKIIKLPMPKKTETNKSLSIVNVTPLEPSSVKTEGHKAGALLRVPRLMPSCPKTDVNDHNESAGGLPEQRVKIIFSAGIKLANKIERAKQVLRHKYPQGKLEEIIDEALETLLEKKDPERKIKRMEKKREVKSQKIPRQTFSSPQNDRSRYIPAAVKRQVWKRDCGQCVFKSPKGRQCGEKGQLEIDHRRPFALGGVSTAENLALLCRLHNQYRSQITFGFRVPRQASASAGGEG